MKTRSLILLAALFVLATPAAVKAQSADFNGNWKLNTEKSQVPSDQLYLLKLTIKVDGNNLVTTRTYSDPNGQEYPFEENLTLDGKECKISVYDMPRTSKATKEADGTIKVLSVTTFYANGGEENLTADETWKLQEGMLVMEVTNKMMGNELKSVSYYSRQAN